MRNYQDTQISGAEGVKVETTSRTTPPQQFFE